MNVIPTPAPALHQPARPAMAIRQAETSPRNHGAATLGNVFATWEERIRFRWDLEQMSRDNPHLIDDIGLTRRQVEAEIAKPFWQR